MIYLRTLRIQYLVVLAIFLFCSPIAGVMSPEEWRSTAPGNFSTLTAEEVSKVAEPLIQNGTYPCLVIILVDPNGSAIYTYGVSNRASGAASNNKTTFEIGSVSKTFTGLLLADAELRGVVNLSAPIQSYVPDGVIVPSWQGREITLADLATHTSGLPNVPWEFYRYQDVRDPIETQAESSFRGYEEISAEMGYDWLSHVTLSRRPGQAWEYSNGGTAIAGDIVARVQNKTFPELVRERILDPLGMKSTAAGWSEDLLNRSATGYRGYAPDRDEGMVIRYNGFWAPAAGIISDADDMAVYLALQLGYIDTPEGLLAAVNRSHQPRVLRSSEGIELWESLFWDTFETKDIPRTHLKAGETNRFMADIAFVRDKGIGVVVLANTAYLSDTHVESDVAIPLNKLMLEKR
ncbi:serine hydrolase domain-containing protein [Methanospirillum sp.]|mgnify:CR=1 FL=1|uniref:serine hydrolase domain-containing protein n=1 Tax=Methanospirillum sp. TaxID=45200 RepID=UPI002C688186|nr:serine hydrolase domain-containing protein [Methanospirillum sp.]HPP77953.1 serine hydrolase domain-containing protein [Methanospirillum sp.]